VQHHAAEIEINLAEYPVSFDFEMCLCPHPGIIAYPYLEKNNMARNGSKLKLLDA
jgi:hypothetical protein